jgi:WXG100 family type VII secretion target
MRMNDVLKADLGGLASLADSLRKDANQIDERLHVLNSQMDGQRANWAGMASDAFASAKQVWSSELSERATVLRMAAGAVDACAAIYADADHAVAASWSI